MNCVTCRRVVKIDSEFDAKKGRGEIPGHPVCICAIEIDQDGRVIEHRLTAPYPAKPPWDHGDDDPHLAVMFAAGAEAGSYLSVSWPFPPVVIDLYAEYMVLHNSEMVRMAGGDSKPPGPSLLKACKRYRVTATLDTARKEEMRKLVYSKTNHTPEEIAEIQDYCLSDDCRMTARLFLAMLPHIDFLRAPLRGAFMMEIERIRWRGIPIDMPTYLRAQRRASAAITRMQEEINRRFGEAIRRKAIGDGKDVTGRRFDTRIYFNGIFKRKTMFAAMRALGIPIPVDPKTGKFSCATKLIKSMIVTYPVLKAFYEYRRMIDALKDLKLEVGDDGRNRKWLNPFGTKTGRNNPSTNGLIFGLPHTMRSFIKPPPGMAIAQVDVGCEEVGIAAALSGDPQLLADYLAGDPYKQFAAAALGISDPTSQQRQLYKQTVLGRIYGLGIRSLARNLGISKSHAQQIFDQMSARYPVLNAWLQRVTTKAAHGVPIVCVLGWELASSGRPGEERTFLNFPMQGNGAELMRLVIVRAGAAGLPLIGCAHDSFMIEAPIAEIEGQVALLQDIVRQASRDLFGLELRADYKPENDLVKYPARYIDKREREDGMEHWNWLMELIADDDEEKGAVA